MCGQEHTIGGCKIVEPKDKGENIDGKLYFERQASFDNIKKRGVGTANPGTLTDIYSLMQGVTYHSSLGN